MPSICFKEWGDGGAGQITDMGLGVYFRLGSAIQIGALIKL